jgi:Outer membrane protein and related peptidoglycan-associated (lipo)proteins
MKRCTISILALSAALCAAALALASCQSKPKTPPEEAQSQAAPASEASQAAQDQAQAQAEAEKAAKAAKARAPIVVPAPSAIRPAADGFWPAPESRARTIALSLLVGDPDKVRSWRVDILPRKEGSSVSKSFAGGAADKPEAVVWDGRDESGQVAREGSYIARLSVDYSADSGLKPVTKDSRPFALALSPPEPTLLASPSRIEVADEGIKTPVSFEVLARPALVPIESWRVDIIAPDGTLFKKYEGAWPESGSLDKLSWDGQSEKGGRVEPGKRYSAILTVRDAYGHAASAQAGVSVADLPFPTERSSVRPWATGFSPNGDKVMDTMDFSLVFGQRASVRSWRLEIAPSGKAALKVFRGSASELPESMSWDGKTDLGSAAPEGRYVASLFIDYGSAFSPAVARSTSFILDVSPPELRFATSPELFAPGPSGPGDEAGPDSTLSMSLEASSALARLADWSVEVIDPGNNVFARFDGQWPDKAPSTQLQWDGFGSNGQLVESAETYRLVARVSDEYGNAARAESSTETDILVTKDGERYRVDVASILFKGYTDDYHDLPPDQAASNLRTLDRLAQKFSKFPGYRIHLVGHAVMINWDDPNMGPKEQAKILVPLSLARAKAIAAALSERGIEASRLSVEGVGAANQVVPDSDLANRWKNRRVEFYLEK